MIGEKTTFVQTNIHATRCSICKCEFRIDEESEEGEAKRIRPHFCARCGEDQEWLNDSGEFTQCQKCGFRFHMSEYVKAGPDGRAGTHQHSPKFCPNCGRQGPPTVDGESSVGKENGGAA